MIHGPRISTKGGFTEKVLKKEKTVKVKWSILTKE